MRGQGNHVPPKVMQELNNSFFPTALGQVTYQTVEWLNTGKFIHFEVAREIADWYQLVTQPNFSITAFAEQGIIMPDLLEALAKERAVCAIYSGDYRDLSALIAYVAASRVV